MKIGHTHISLVQTMLVFSCNMSCEYCYQDFSKDLGKKKMSIETFQRILDMFQGKDIDLNLFGGEPLLNQEIIDYMLSSKFQLPSNIKILSVNTNGIFLNQKFAMFYEKFKDVIYIDLSLDGNQEVHDYYRKLHGGNGTYKLIVENLKFFPDLSKFRINFCVSPFAADKLYEALNNLRKLGFTKIKTMFLYEKKWSKENIYSLTGEALKIKKLQPFLDVTMFHSYNTSPTECRDDFLDSYTFLPSGDIVPCPVWISKNTSRVPTILPKTIASYSEKEAYVEENVFGNTELLNIINSGTICESIQGLSFAQNKKKIESIFRKIYI